MQWASQPWGGGVSIDNLKQCEAIRADGMRCERRIPLSQTHCYSHDETRRAERKANASVAAKAKNSQSELVQVRIRLKQLGEDVLAGRVDKSSASVAATVWGVYLRAVETESKRKEQEELEQLREDVSRLEQMADNVRKLRR